MFVKKIHPSPNLLPTMSSEILNLSYGQYSNNTTTHLYNFQESQVPYTKDTKLNHNLSTFLYKSVANGSGSANYYPRALLFDLRGGLGALNKYEYAEQVPHLDMPISNQQSANTQLQKNEYQISLDQGKTDGSLLNTGNTKYWTDYNKLIYNPKSVITLPSFQHEYNDLGSNYNLPAQKFDIYSTGVEEFKTIEVESVENFRYWLEKCDFLQGLQIGTSWNDSWGGFTTSMIEVVQDEFFNNKENIWIYGQVNQQSQAGNLPIMRRVSQIKSFIELYKSSSLFFPLSPDYNSSMLSDIDASSVWHTSCIPALFINSIWGINNQYIDQVNMLHMQENLLRGDEARKIVNEIKIVGEKDETALGDMMMDVDLTKVHDLLSAVVTQQSQEPEINLGISKPTENARYINKNCIVDNKDKLDGNGTRGGAEVDEVPTNVYKNPYMCQMAEIDTFPNILQNKHAKYHVEFNVHNGVKDLLKPYQTIIENLRLNLDDLIEDKGELVEDISNIISSYSSGFESDDDDYYD